MANAQIYSPPPQTFTSTRSKVEKKANDIFRSNFFLCDVECKTL